MKGTYRVFTCFILCSLFAASINSAPINLSLKDGSSFKDDLSAPFLQSLSWESTSQYAPIEESSKGMKARFESKPILLSKSGQDCGYAMNLINPNATAGSITMAFRYKSSSRHKKSTSNFITIPLNPGTTRATVTFPNGGSAVVHQAGFDQLLLLVKKAGGTVVTDRATIQWITLASSTMRSLINPARAIPSSNPRCTETTLPSEEIPSCYLEDNNRPHITVTVTMGKAIYSSVASIAVTRPH
jgi:hypothetical protein